MARRRWKSEITILSCFELFAPLLLLGVGGAVLPPPWADPKLNPCASRPRGWQLLYWPPDGKCYKIFQKGHPCPEGMELSPAPSAASVRSFSAECRCPPATAQSAKDGQCYDLFTAGPCEKGHYFAPDTEYSSSVPSKRRWGTCKQTTKCPNINEIYWPQTGRCYLRLTKGPCPKGQLLTTGADDLAVCKCNIEEMEEYYDTSNGCFQHFTKGPCKRTGHLFLPDRQCGCHEFLPHYHEESERCFEIGSIEPCDTGQSFQMNPDTGRASCVCKPGHILHSADNKCYRPYTQGPCDPGHILVNRTSCIMQPCRRGHLYFPFEDRCYRVGTRGPCPEGQLVTFDFETRPSVDGLSYNGLCACVEPDCEKLTNVRCESDALVYENRCYKLYTQGPCAKGAWIVPKRQGKEELWTESKNKKGVCDCMPGYAKSVRTYNGKNITECISPTVLIADFLNKNYFEQMQNLNTDEKLEER